MTNLIVPVDFSDTSKNAARYAAHLSTLIHDAHIILYYVYDVLEYGSDSSPLDTTGGEEESRHKIMELALQNLGREISPVSDAKISCIAERSNHFVNSLENYVRNKNIQFIVMGITGATRLTGIMMGSNTLKVINRRIAPVIIVPPDAQPVTAKNVMLLTDLDDVENSIPVETIKRVLNMLKPNLYVVNIDSERYPSLTEQGKGERAKLEKMLEAFSPEFNFIRMTDFMEGINQVVKDKKIELILTVPKQRSFLSNLFKTTHTSTLAYHSHVPIIAVNS